jgi:hypothetical protein
MYGSRCSDCFVQEGTIEEYLSIDLGSNEEDDDEV